MGSQASLVVKTIAVGLLVGGLALTIGCPKQAPAKYVDGNDGVLPSSTTALCKTAVCDLTAGAGQPGTGQPRGTVTVSNDNFNLYVTFAPADGFAIGVTHVDVTCTAPTERGAPGQYHSIIDLGGLVTFPATVTHTFPFGEESGSDGCILDVDCESGEPLTFYIRAHANTYLEDGTDPETGFGGVSGCDDGATSVHVPAGGGSWFAYIEYAPECCDDSGGTDEGCTTYTQGGWGAPAHGNNPGTIRDAVFATCFPSGLVIGCVGGRSVTFTSAAAIEAYLPAGGPPSVLTEDDDGALDPTSTGAGVLGGQLIAAKMNVCADANYADFPECDLGAIGGLCYEDDTSPLDGMTVAEIILAADEAIGGCSTDYTPNELNTALTNINENFHDGNDDLGYLVACPD
jgi:hypothetical protein